MSAAEDSWLWGGVRFGATGNMWGNESLAVTENVDSKQVPESAMAFTPNVGYPAMPIEEEFGGRMDVYFPHQNGIQQLPCFRELPVEKLAAIRVPVSFDAYAVIHTVQLRGLFTPEFPEGYVQSLVQAYLGIDVLGAGWYEAYTEYRQNFLAWETVVQQHAADNGIVLVKGGRELFDANGEPYPSRALFSQYVRDNSAVLPPRPVAPEEIFVIRESPYQYYNNPSFGRDYVNKYSSIWDLYKTRFLGLDFRFNPLFAGLERVGKEYRYHFMDNTTLIIKGILDEDMIDNCFAFLPLEQRNALKEEVATGPVKPIFPYYTNSLLPRTNPNACWNVQDGSDQKQRFLKIGEQNSGCQTQQKKKNGDAKKKFTFYIFWGTFALSEYVLALCTIAM